jgi:RNase P/RNase MRP subunit POP5
MYVILLMVVHALIEAFQGDFAYIMKLPINLFLRKRYLAFKQDSQYLKHNYKKGVVSLIRNTLISLNPEWVVTLNRNQVVSLSGISS